MASSTTPSPNPIPIPPDIASKHIPLAEKVSFAAALKIPKLRPRFQPVPLPARQYGTKEGSPTISFTAAEIDAGAKHFRFSLIAKFTIGRPSIDTIRKAFQANWDIKGRATLSEIWDGRHLLVILDTEEDMITALTCPLRKVQHSNFRLFRYSVDYNYKRESTTTTKWIRLPGLPPNFFHKSYIGAIVSSFATFLDIDDRTKACASMRYARACIEIDVTEAIPNKVWIALPDDKGYWQEITVEGNMAYCSHCKVHGHELSVCRKKKPASDNSNRQVNQISQSTDEGWQAVKGRKSNRAKSTIEGPNDYGPDNLARCTREVETKSSTKDTEGNISTSIRNETNIPKEQEVVIPNSKAKAGLQFSFKKKISGGNLRAVRNPISEQKQSTETEESDNQEKGNESTDENRGHTDEGGTSNHIHLNTTKPTFPTLQTEKEPEIQTTNQTSQ